MRNGSESPSDRHPARHHQAPRLHLVRQRRPLRREPSCRHGSAGFRAKETGQRLGVPGGDREAGQEREDHDLHRPPRHRDRQEGRGCGGPARGTDGAHGNPGAGEHRGGAQARPRRPVGGRQRGPAVGAAGDVPPGHEAGGAERHADGRRRHQGAGVGPSRRRRNRPHRMVSRGPGAAAHPARRHRLRHRRGRHHLRHHRREGVDIQGRGVRP